MTTAPSALRPHEYVFPDQHMSAYDIDRGFQLIQRHSLPGIRGIRGIVFSPRTRMWCIGHGGDGGPNGHGSLMAYDLRRGTEVWNRAYPFGIGRIDGGKDPHNTVVGPSGRYVYPGGCYSPYLNVPNTATEHVIKEIGPLRSGVRPFAINGSETLAYTIATGFLGFQVSGIAAGRILATVRFGSRFTWNPAHFHANAPSHGISLSPNDGQLCVLNAPNRYVQVFDVRGRFSSHPLQVANLELADPLPVAFISALRDTPKMLEIDWRGGTPTSTSTRTGPGYLRW